MNTFQRMPNLIRRVKILLAKERLQWTKRSLEILEMRVEKKIRLNWLLQTQICFYSSRISKSVTADLNSYSIRLKYSCNIFYKISIGKKGLKFYLFIWMDLKAWSSIEIPFTNLLMSRLFLDKRGNWWESNLNFFPFKCTCLMNFTKKISINPYTITHFIWKRFQSHFMLKNQFKMKKNVNEIDHTTIWKEMQIIFLNWV